MAYIPGNWWMNCPVCGFSRRRSQMKRRWDGVYVCSKDWEPKHPLLNQYRRAEKVSVYPVNPDPEAKFLSDNEVTTEDL